MTKLRAECIISILEQAIFRKFPLSDDQVMKSQVLAIFVNKRNSLLMSQGDAMTGPVFRLVTHDGSFSECDSSSSVPVPTFTSEKCPLHSTMACLLDLFPVLSSPMPCIHPRCHAEGKAFSHPCVCSPVSHTARWQAGIASSFWLLTE